VAGVVDQYVDAAEALLRDACDVMHLGKIGDVQR
jgi:hypothetical protein